MTNLSPFRGAVVAVAAVARPVGTPGVQRVGRGQPQPAAPLRRDRTGGVPPPPPRHPVAVFGRSAVRRGPAVGRPVDLRRGGRNTSSGVSSARWARVVGCRTSECWNAAVSRQPFVGFGSTASAAVPVCGCCGLYGWLPEHRNDPALLADVAVARPQPVAAWRVVGLGCAAPCLGVALFGASVISAEVFVGCDFNLGGVGIRDIRGRVVSRLRPFNHGRGYAVGYTPSRFTDSLVALAITCAGYLAVIFSGLFAQRRA